MIDPISLGISALGAVGGLVQGIEAKKKQRDAERAAQEALNEAKKKLSVNRLEGVQIPLSAYNEAFKSNVAQQQQALSALTESDPRALAAGVGKVQAAGVSQDEMARQAMERAVYNRDVMVAENQGRIDAALASTSLSEVEGAQQAALQAEQQAAAGFTGAIQSAASGAQNFYEASDLYKKNNTDAANMFQREGQINTAPLTSNIGNSSFNNNIGANSMFGANNLMYSLQPMQTGLIKFQ